MYLLFATTLGQTWEQWKWRNTLHSLKLRYYRNLTIRLFSVISRALVAGVLPLYREGVGIFYSPSTLCNYIREMTYTDYMCQEKGEEDSPALKIVYLHQYENLRTPLKRAKKDKLQRPVTALATLEQTEQLAKYQTRRPWNSNKRETLRDKLNLLKKQNKITPIILKAKIDKMQQNSKCGFCGDKDETIYHIM